MDGNLQLFKGVEENFQPVRKSYRTGGIGEKKCACDEQHNAKNHFNGPGNALPGDNPAGKNRGARRIENIQNRSERDDDQHGFKTFEEVLCPDAGKALTDDRNHQNQTVGNPAVSREKRNNIKQDQNNLCAGIQPVNNGIAGKILAERNILQHVTPPL